MYRVCLYVSLVIAVIIASSGVNGQTTMCTGYPKTFNGKPCASTTRYWDGQKGACGCGSADTNPFSWQWTKLTAAASAPIFGSSTWCGSGCGKCFKLTPTAVGASPIGAGATTTNSVVAKVTNLCPYSGNEQWCAYDVNSYGYDAHFDLMDYNMDGLVTAMGWNNPEVTYEEVDCASNGYIDWGCQCASNGTTTGSSSPVVPATPAPTKGSTTTTTTTTTKAPTSTTTTKAPSTSTKAPSTSTKAPSTSTTKASTSTTTKAPTSTTTTKAPSTSTTTKAASTSTTTTKAPSTSTTTTTVKAPVSSAGSVKIQVSGGSNAWWIGFSVVGANDVSKVEIMDGTSIKSWAVMSSQGDSNWNIYYYQASQQMSTPISLRFTSVSGQVSIANNIITSFQAIVVDTTITL